jgi:hypothetical protein
MPTEEDFINVSATALHNQSFSKTELAQKKRLEILVRFVPTKLYSLFIVWQDTFQVGKQERPALCHDVGG